MINMKDYGFEDEVQKVEGMEVARITAVHRERFEIICSKGEGTAIIKNSIYYDQESEAFPTVGDFVWVEYHEQSLSRIVKTFKRKSYFSRQDPDKGRGEQVVAANFDYVFIVMSLNHDFNTKRLERYLAAAWQSGALPVIILTKADLIEDYSEYLLQLEHVAIGVEIIPISAKTGFGVEALSHFIEPGKTVVFLGSSGVGKSTLVNTLAGQELMKTNEVREKDDRGHHTTTYRQLIKLASGGMIIDTPGMRELGVWDVTTGLGEAFRDVTDLILQCKFSDCTHKNEPGCKICEALANGSLEKERWQSYIKIKKEARYSEDKNKYFQEMKQVNRVYKKAIRKQKSILKRLLRR